MLSLLILDLKAVDVPYIERMIANLEAALPVALA
jgi:orotidine-5'-phosphate decarboxylase